MLTYLLRYNTLALYPNIKAILICSSVLSNVHSIYLIVGTAKSRLEPSLLITAAEAWTHDIIRNFSKSDSTILHNNFLHYFNVLLWETCTTQVHFFAQNRLSTCHSQHFKCVRAVDYIFHINSLIYSYVRYKYSYGDKLLLNNLARLIE